MIWPIDEKSWLSVKERHWDDERAAAARLRLIRPGRQPLGVAVSALRIIEHMYYFVRAYLTSSPEVEDEIDPELDAELERLFALLSPTGEVLHVERVVRQVGSEAEEEACFGRCD